MSTSPLLFLHIQKTAGTSLRAAIAEHFMPDRICNAYAMHNFTKLPSRALKEYDFFPGHYPHSAVERFYPIVPRVITLLRDPVARSISNLRHIKEVNHDNFWQEEYLPIKEMSMDELIHDPFVGRWLKDYQLRILAFDFDLKHFTSPMILQVPQEVDNALLEKAKRRLESYDFVGVTEQMERSIRLLTRIFGWPDIEELPQENRAKERQHSEEPISESAMEHLYNITAWDRKLYDFACELFEKRFKEIFG